MIKTHLFIEGRVQGVFYRAWSKKKAIQLGLSGWVRNRLDGRVEMVLVGPPNKVKAMIEACWQGPPLAQVKKITIVSQKKINQDPFEGRFEKRETS